MRFKATHILATARALVLTFVLAGIGISVAGTLSSAPEPAQMAEHR